MWMAPRPGAPGSVDSRSYIFALPIRSANDLPGDFNFPDDLGELSHGVFLPRAEPDWRGRRAYPPRVALLSEDSLVIVAHPASGEAVCSIPFRELQFVEYGHFLLIGWMAFVSSQGRRELPFNTRTCPPMEEFLSKLSKQCAPPLDLVDGSPCSSFGGALDIKFQNAELAALDRDERVLIRFFNPTRETERRAWGLFPVDSHQPGDYLAITNRRLLWITERNRDRYARYGSIVKWAVLGNVADLLVEGAGRSCRLVCRFKSGASWDVPLPADQSDAAAAFASKAVSVIRSSPL
jgi:hypothetical protein